MVLGRFEDFFLSFAILMFEFLEQSLIPLIIFLCNRCFTVFLKTFPSRSFFATKPAFIARSSLER